MMDPWFEDVLLELLRAGAVALILARLLHGGRGGPLLAAPGGRLIVGGFGLVLFGTLIDITDNFPALNRLVVVGDTPVQAFLEKLVGYLGGFTLVAVGVWRWLPAVAAGLAQRAQIAAQSGEAPAEPAEAMRRLARSQAFLHTVLETMGEGVLVVGADRRIRYANLKAEQLLGWPAGGLDGEPLEVVTGAEGPAREAVVRSLAEGTEEGRVEADLLARGGAALPVDLALAPLQGGGGVVVTFQDLRARRQLEAELRRMAAQDPLTGLANRRELERLLRLELGRAARHGRPLAVLVLDVDRFKLVNDSHGHHAGDRVLVELARRLRGLTREVDVVGRLGGDEFVVVLPETDLSGGLAFAERVRAAVGERPFQVDGLELPVTVSLGVAAFPDHGESLRALLVQGDRALYAAKAAGRNRVSAGAAG